MIKIIIFDYQEYNFDADQYIYDRRQPAVCIWCGSFDVVITSGVDKARF